MTFDFYASLGENCEGAFQIRRVLGQDDSCFFSWNITPPAALIALLDGDFQDIMQPEAMVRHSTDLIRDSKYNYMFHSDFPSDEDIRFGEYPDIVANHQQKAQYLIAKLRGNAADETKKTAYFYKTQEPADKEKAVEMLESLKTLHNNNENFVLVFLQPEEKAESDWNIAQLKNRYLKRIASYADATDGHVSSWDRIFSEFPHIKPLRLSGY
ncbi:DUF1796 family putative cysteine peptidase [Asticcacaulis machinosus]|uniref:DUF1796 family putative cysteine peptidase n=1 Tax=Asticcacaulis machinosus TaxID=2984211 RepID=A0ABT5HJS6_9CAUL|nr:DUF1796 family putative cysteine peptidase [Asticcacaulis machinosus]MDC7676500.1 DUF1796 family putative cysteine peptidase [Asticcacaulis machinosus]